RGGHGRDRAGRRPGGARRGRERGGRGGAGGRPRLARPHSQGGRRRRLPATAARAAQRGRVVPGLRADLRRGGQAGSGRGGQRLSYAWPAVAGAPAGTSITGPDLSITSRTTREQASTWR